MIFRAADFSCYIKAFKDVSVLQSLWNRRQRLSGRIFVNWLWVCIHKSTRVFFLRCIYELMLLGRIRNTPEPADELDDDSCVLSLGLFPGEVLEVPGDDRYCRIQ